MPKTAPAPKKKKSVAPEIPASLENQVGYRLRMAQLAVFSDIIDALKETGLRPVDLSALILIDAQPGVRQSTICTRLRMLRPNVVALIDSLEARGLVDRHVDAQDRRANQIHLTEAGRLIFLKALDIQKEHAARIDAALDGVDIDNLMLGLKRLSALSDGQK